MKKYAMIRVMALAVLLAACRPDDVPTPPAGEAKERTLLIYMAAQNSLGANGNIFDYLNIKALLGGIREPHLRNNNVLIYHDPMVAADGRADTRPRLLQVVMDNNGKAVAREVEIFVEQNSASVEVMSEVINRVLNNAAFRADRYGFLMWSHGTGWLPPTPDYTPHSRAIGQDGNDWMDINDFAAAIPDGVFDYIAMDACYMGAAEFAYAMQGKADYLIAAPTEIMETGMPYHMIPDYLLGATPDYNGFCDAFYNFYENDYYGSTISLIRPDEMDALASVVRNILQYVTLDQIHAIPTEVLQRFDRNRDYNGGINELHPYILFFDLGSFLRQVANQVQMQTFEQAMAAVVPYERHSSSFLLVSGGYGFEITEYCGLSVYVPRDIPQLGGVNSYYDTLGWAQAVYHGATVLP